jgi:hypothetical protein
MELLADLRRKFTFGNNNLAKKQKIIEKLWKNIVKLEYNGTKR